MKESSLPLWFKQISYQKENGIIGNGLTIPYLIGSYQICNQLLDDRPMKSLILQIVESDLEKCAVLQMCPAIRQYVIGIDDRDYCDQYMKTYIKFENSVGKSSLYITLNANNLGNDINKIVEQFEDLYSDCIEDNKFSWNNQKKKWDKFTEQEIDLVEKAK